jgi:hypothetical protein
MFVDLIVKAIYSLILVGISLLCLSEVYQVWARRALEYGRFTATKDGEDAQSTGDSFRRLIVAQQGAIYQLFQGQSQREIVTDPDGIQIALDDLGGIQPKSVVDDLKIEAGGVNVTSVLSTLRRWMISPNEITGSVDIIDKRIYVIARWPKAPRLDGNGAELHVYDLQGQADIVDASFSLACEIFLSSVAAKNPEYRQISEEDFCTYIRALQGFRDYVAARDRGISKQEATVALDHARSFIDDLVDRKVDFPYAYKLAAYEAIESASVSQNEDETKENLDRAEALLIEYRKRRNEAVPIINDPEADDRLVYLYGRKGTISTETYRSTSYQTSAQQTEAIAQAITDIASKPVTETRTAGLLRPGVSIGIKGSTIAASACCFVKDTVGHVFLLTAAYVSSEKDGGIGADVVSPATVDGGGQVIGKMSKILDGFAWIELTDPSLANNGELNGVVADPKPGEKVVMLGRTSQRADGAISDASLTMAMAEAIAPGPLILVSLPTAPGDGGGPVMNSDKALIGMLVGRSIRGSLVAPIAKYLETHDLELISAN